MINQVINKLLTNAKFKFYKYTALPVCLYVLVCACMCLYVPTFAPRHVPNLSALPIQHQDYTVKPTY